MEYFCTCKKKSYFNTNDFSVQDIGFMVTSLIFDKNVTVYIKVTKIGIDMKLMKFKFHVLFLIFASILMYLYPGFPTAKLKKKYNEIILYRCFT